MSKYGLIPTLKETDTIEYASSSDESEDEVKFSTDNICVFLKAFSGIFLFEDSTEKTR